MILRRQTTKFLVRCDNCGRVGHNIYHVDLNGRNVKVCGEACAKVLESKNG